MMKKFTIAFAMIILLAASVSAAELQNFAKLCGGDYKGVAMEFADSNTQNAVNAYETGGCLATYGTACAASLIGGQIKSAAQSQILNALVVAVPQIGPALAVYNDVNTLSAMGSQVKGCINTDKNGDINEIDSFEIKSASSQDISNYFYGNNKKLDDNQKIIANNVKLSKQKDKNFIMETSENSELQLNGQKMYLASGSKIEIEQTKDSNGSVNSADVKTADIIIGDQGSTIKFGDYSGDFPPGAHVLFDKSKGFTVTGNGMADLTDKNGIKSSLVLGNSSVNVFLVNGSYKYEGQSFEVDGIKFYSVAGKAGMTISDKGIYTKSSGSIAEYNKLKMDGGEYNIVKDFNTLSTESKQKLQNLGKSNIVLSNNNIEIYGGANTKGNFELEFLEGNPYVKTNGKVSIKSRENAWTSAIISGNKNNLGIMVDSGSGALIQNGNGGWSLLEGEMYIKAHDLCSVYSENSYISKCKTQNGLTTNMSLEIVDKITAPGGTSVETSFQGQGEVHYIARVNEVDAIGISKCSEGISQNTLSGQMIRLTGFATLLEKCTIYVNANLRGKNTLVKENNKVVVYDALGKKEVEVVQLSAGKYVSKDEEPLAGTNIMQKTVYDSEGTAIGFQQKEGDTEYGKVNYYNQMTEPETPKEQPKAPVQEKPSQILITLNVGVKFTPPYFNAEVRDAVLYDQLNSNEEQLLQKAIRKEVLSSEEVAQFKSSTAIQSFLKSKGYKANIK